MFPCCPGAHGMEHGFQDNQPTQTKLTFFPNHPSPQRKASILSPAPKSHPKPPPPKTPQPKTSPQSPRSSPLHRPGWRSPFPPPTPRSPPQSSARPRRPSQLRLPPGFGGSGWSWGFWSVLVFLFWFSLKLARISGGFFIASFCFGILGALLSGCVFVNSVFSVFSWCLWCSFRVLSMSFLGAPGLFSGAFTCSSGFCSVFLSSRLLFLKVFLMFTNQPPSTGRTQKAWKVSWSFLHCSTLA